MRSLNRCRIFAAEFSPPILPPDPQPFANAKITETSKLQPVGGNEFTSIQSSPPPRVDYSRF